MTAPIRRPPLLIVADTYAQACLYARETERGRDWRYVRTPRDVHGRHGGEYVLLTIPGHPLSLDEIDNRLRVLETLHIAGFANIDPGAST